MKLQRQVEDLFSQLTKMKKRRLENCEESDPESIGKFKNSF
jgi:hypothetical protein